MNIQRLQKYPDLFMWHGEFIVTDWAEFYRQYQGVTLFVFFCELNQNNVTTSPGKGKFANVSKLFKITSVFIWTLDFVLRENMLACDNNYE